MPYSPMVIPCPFSCGTNTDVRQVKLLAPLLNNSSYYFDSYFWTGFVLHMAHNLISYHLADRGPLLFEDPQGNTIRDTLVVRNVQTLNSVGGGTLVLYTLCSVHVLTVFCLRCLRKSLVVLLSPPIVFLDSPSTLFLYGVGVIEELFSVPGSGYFLPVSQSLGMWLIQQGDGGAVVALGFVSCTKAFSSV